MSRSPRWLKSGFVALGSFFGGLWGGWWLQGDLGYFIEEAKLPHVILSPQIFHLGQLTPTHLSDAGIILFWFKVLAGSMAISYAGGLAPAWLSKSAITRKSLYPALGFTLALAAHALFVVWIFSAGYRASWHFHLMQRLGGSVGRENIDFFYLWVFPAAALALCWWGARAWLGKTHGGR